MTREERAAKYQIIKQLSKEGYGIDRMNPNKITYVSLFDLFDLHLTDDPETIAYVELGKGVITINKNLDLNQVSLVVRHEIMHEYEDHMKRFIEYVAKERGVSPEDVDLDTITDEEHEDENMAADWELSNRTYTDKDKIVAKGIRLKQKDGSWGVVHGLVTDIDHPDWVNDDMETMYSRLEAERKKHPKKSGIPEDPSEKDIDLKSGSDPQGNIDIDPDYREGWNKFAELLRKGKVNPDSLQKQLDIEG